MVDITYSVSLWNYTHHAAQPTLERVIGELRESGYGIELWGSCWNEGDLYDPVGRSRLRPALRGMTVTLHTVGNCARDFERHRKQIDTAAVLGARLIVLHPDDVNSRPDLTGDWGILREAVAYARQRKVRLALENGWYDFRGVRQALDKADDLECCLDVGHIYLYPGNTMGEYLKQFKHRLTHLHLQDICPPDLRKVPGAWQDHYVPGRGGIPPEDWELLCSTLEEINFRGIAVFEIHPLAVLEEVFRARRFFDGQLADEGSGGARAVRAAKPTVKIARRQRGR